jgi:hypothetical protein
MHLQDSAWQLIASAMPAILKGNFPSGLDGLQPSWYFPISMELLSCLIYGMFQSRWTTFLHVFLIPKIPWLCFSKDNLKKHSKTGANRKNEKINSIIKISNCRVLPCTLYNFFEIFHYIDCKIIMFEVRRKVILSPSQRLFWVLLKVYFESFAKVILSSSQ